MQDTSVAGSPWLLALSEIQPKAAELLSAPVREQEQKGYFHTLREICHQPSTWLRTSQQMVALNSDLQCCLDGAQALVLTGSGSSEYAGDCVRIPLKNELSIVTEVIAGGSLLTHGSRILPPARPLLMVSLARSGDSPETVGALSLLIETEPEIRHLILTCNERGRVVNTFSGHSRVRVIALDDRTNDRSLVMTSSFSNLVLAARYLGMLNVSEKYQALCRKLSQVGSELLRTHFGTLARIASSRFRKAVYLGSRSRLGGARETALKMLEMTSGSVGTLSESYLGLRHGPMSYIDKETLIVCFLSSDPMLRAYESDLLREVDRKGLGQLKIILGENVPQQLLQKNDVAIECSGLNEVGDENASVIDVVVGQLLGFFRCLEGFLRPDSPSENGIINRVVESFALHSPQTSADRRT